MRFCKPIVYHSADHKMMLIVIIWKKIIINNLADFDCNGHQVARAATGILENHWYEMRWVHRTAYSPSPPQPPPSLFLLSPITFSPQPPSLPPSPSPPPLSSLSLLSFVTFPPQPPSPPPPHHFPSSPPSSPPFLHQVRDITASIDFLFPHKKRSLILNHFSWMTITCLHIYFLLFVLTISLRKGFFYVVFYDIIKWCII